jgi:hypothetical protein
MRAVRALAVSVLSLCVWCVPAFAVAQVNGSEPPAIPDHVVYWDLFQRVASQAHAQRQADAAGQDQRLVEIALECEKAVAVQDAKAKTLIDQFHRQHPARLLSKDAHPPTPPAELTSLWEQRITTILTARDRLRGALGEEAFAILDQEQKARAAQHITPVSLPNVGRP